jgi:3-phosphoshikimate 1-carboxyvinyltransferase
MEKAQIIPITHPLRAKVQVPGSKSITNRALLIAALASGTTRLSNALFSDDSRYFANALHSLGFEVQPDPDKQEIVVSGRGGLIPSGKSDLYIGNAGTAARFLSAFLTLGHGEFILDGDARMRQRPIADLVSALSQLGADIQTTSQCPPVRISASGLLGGKTLIPGNISSQFLSALLMVSPYAQTAVEINVSTDLNSKPYVDMTLAVMADFGVEIARAGYSNFKIDSGRYSAVDRYTIEPDASAASYFFAAPAILGGTVRVGNITRLSKQGDIAFLDVLQKMGCIVVEGTDYLEVSGTDVLVGVDVDMSDIPDTAQTLAAIAPFASSPTRIRGIASARVKETDRVSATCTELRRLGVQVEEFEDGMVIYPCQTLAPGCVATYNDHRMAMAFALIGLRLPGISIENPGCVSKTFPNYFSVLETLR